MTFLTLIEVLDLIIYNLVLKCLIPKPRRKRKTIEQTRHEKAGQTALKILGVKVQCMTGYNEQFDFCLTLVEILNVIIYNLRL